MAKFILAKMKKTDGKTFILGHNPLGWVPPAQASSYKSFDDAKDALNTLPSIRGVRIVEVGWEPAGTKYEQIFKGAFDKNHKEDPHFFTK